LEIEGATGRRFYRIEGSTGAVPPRIKVLV